jgi:hypothetical protein
LEIPVLPLQGMADRHPGLTPEIAGAYVQAALVCLDRHHSSPSEFRISEGTNASRATIQWESVDERIKGAWANEIDATEAGAYACSLAATELSKGLVAVRRAETGTGADYYVGPVGTGLNDLESFFRLEVSGTDRGSYDRVAAVLRQKVQQTKDGNSNLPAIAAVVGFRAQIIMIEAVEGGP